MKGCVHACDTNRAQCVLCLHTPKRTNMHAQWVVTIQGTKARVGGSSTQIQHIGMLIKF